MARIRFKDVGRDKKTWDADIPTDSDGRPNGAAMIKSIREHGALMSRDIDLLPAHDASTGTICVGVFRPVGRWENIDHTCAPAAKMFDVLTTNMGSYPIVAVGGTRTEPTWGDTIVLVKCDRKDTKDNARGLALANLICDALNALTTEQTRELLAAGMIPPKFPAGPLTV